MVAFIGIRQKGLDQNDLISMICYKNTKFIIKL